MLLHICSEEAKGLVAHSLNKIMVTVIMEPCRATLMLGTGQLPQARQLWGLITRDVRNRFLSFGSVSVRFLKKNSDSVRNEFGSVQFAKTLFGSDSYLLLM